MDRTSAYMPAFPQRFFALRPRTRRLVLASVFGGGYVVSIATQLAAAQGMLGVLLQAFHTLAVVASFVALWMLLSEALRDRTSTASSSFGGAVVLAVALLIGGWGLMALRGTPSNIVDAPATAGTGVVITSSLMALLAGVFAFGVLLCLRSLVLFKRTRTSQRNWFWMLGLMGLAALCTLGKAPSDDFNVWQSLLVVPAVLMMIANSFRLSWMVFLSTKEKWSSIGLSLLLITVLGLNLDMSLDSEAHYYLGRYSAPLSTFVTLTITFGILYATTAFLSLLFHLPTTSAIQQKTGEIAALHALASESGPMFDVGKLASAIVASPVRAGLAHAAWLALPPRNGDGVRVAAAHKIAPERVEELVDVAACYDEVAQSRTPLLLETAPLDERVAARAGYDGLDCLLVLPLVAREELLGILFLSKEVAYGFEDDDVEGASVFAGQIAMALDNARLFEEHVEKERLEREMDIAREVQQKLLPQQLPVARGLSLAASSVPARDIGGDYYDVVALDDDRLAVIIADVSGKGTSAAFYMAELQGIFRALSRLASSPAEFLEHANQALADALEKHIFISAFYGIIDLQEETFTVARAGHCPLATINLHGETELLRTRGLGLGLHRGSLFGQTLDEKTLSLQPGDVFVLYTDGVVESRNAAGEVYGYERLLHALRENRHEEAETLHAALLDDLDAFTEGHYDDDMTLFVLKWHGLDMTRLQADAERAQSAPEPQRTLSTNLS